MNKRTNKPVNHIQKRSQKSKFQSALTAKTPLRKKNKNPRLALRVAWTPMGKEMEAK